MNKEKKEYLIVVKLDIWEKLIKIKYKENHKSMNNVIKNLLEKNK